MSCTGGECLNVTPKAHSDSLVSSDQRHKVGDFTTVPSRDGVGPFAAWASDNVPMPKQ